MKRGFTLLELMIAIVIIGILVTIAVPQYAIMTERGKVAEAKAKLDIIRKAEHIYYSLHGEYTEDGDALSVEVPEAGVILSDVANWDFTIDVPNQDVFRAFAIRQSGPYIDKRIRINQLGEIMGDHPFR